MSTGTMDSVDTAGEPRVARVKRRDGAPRLLGGTLDAAPPARPLRGERGEREVFDPHFHGAILARRRLGLSPTTTSP
ncbi:MAG: hypothetical protein ABJE95_23795 [Byssovorax sp.]